MLFFYQIAALLILLSIDEESFFNTYYKTRRQSMMVDYKPMFSSLYSPRQSKKPELVSRGYQPFVDS